MSTMAASPKEKFDAAVAVIETLPKNVSSLNPGNFVPSHSMLLKFYGYFKQATLGPCNIPRPAFWDIIGKAKWDAWNKLGNMDKEAAMLGYVEELKQVLTQQYPNGYNKEEIVEAMPHTETVQNFVQKLGNFYELVDAPPPRINDNKGQGDGSGDSGQGSLPGTPQRSSGANSEDDASHELLDPNNSKDTLEDSELDQEELLIRAIKQDQIDGLDEEQAAAMLQMQSVQMTGTSAAMNGSAVMATDPTGGPVAVVMNGGPGHLDMGSNSESEGEEFCDTSDAPLTQEKRAQLEYSGPPGGAISRVPQSGSLPHFTSSSSSQLFHLDPGQMIDRDWSSGNLAAAGMTPNQSVSDMLTMRGGGETLAGNNPPGVHTDGTSQSLTSQNRGAVPRRTHPTSSRTHLMSAGGGSGGRGNEGGAVGPNAQFPDINEQITVALIRLQQDMNSVLTRLNTLEGLTVAQQRSRENSGSGQRGSGQSVRWWWPFSGVRGRTVFFILVWPVVVHWIFVFLSKRRNRRVVA